MNDGLKAEFESGALGTVIALILSMATTTSEFVCRTTETFLRVRFNSAWVFFQRWEYTRWIGCHRPRVFMGQHRTNPSGTTQRSKRDPMSVTACTGKWNWRCK